LGILDRRICKLRVILKNGKIGKLVKDVHIIFDDGDGHSYTVPANDIIEEVKNENYKKEEGLRCSN
jgi:hypothetical protein